MFHWLDPYHVSVIVFLPFLFGLLVAMCPHLKTGKALALIGSLLTLSCCFSLSHQFSKSSPHLQFYEEYSWIPQLGVKYMVGVDGLNLLLILLTSFLLTTSKRTPKILMIDVDLHYPDGTVDTLDKELHDSKSGIFLLNLSFSGSDFFPHRVHKERLNMVHTDVPDQTTGEEYIEALSQGIKHIKEEKIKSPVDFVIVSYGFDTSEADRIHKFSGQGFRLEKEHFKIISKTITTSFPGSKIMAVLEGGYTIKPLKENIKSALEGFYDIES